MICAQITHTHLPKLQENWPVLHGTETCNSVLLSSVFGVLTLYNMICVPIAWISDDIASPPSISVSWEQTVAISLKNIKPLNFITEMMFVFRQYNDGPTAAWPEFDFWQLRNNFPPSYTDQFCDQTYSVGTRESFLGSGAERWQSLRSPKLSHHYLLWVLKSRILGVYDSVV